MKKSDYVILLLESTSFSRIAKGVRDLKLNSPTPEMDKFLPDLIIKLRKILNTEKLSSTAQSILKNEITRITNFMVKNKIRVPRSLDVVL